MSDFHINWREGLSTRQIDAANHIGTHALLLSGPGTGKTKTITKRVLVLLTEHDVTPDNVLVLTFTRIAAYKLRNEIESTLKPLGISNPYISTLHSFALRQLLRNSSKIDRLPMPLRIADDWEEQNIIYENIKNDLSEHLKTNIPEKKKMKDKVEYLFNQLSSDWDTLTEDDDLQKFCRDGKFIGAWKEHREIFGYTLRSELIYQLKKSLEQVPDFKIEPTFKYILVDEYQDLNSCDMAVIEEMVKKGGELFIAGDDDQSIYGFRNANPLGIREFQAKYKAKRFDLEICYRCDKKILELAEYIANLDYRRLTKNIRPREGAGEGEVKLLRFNNQYSEANWIASKCKEILHINNSTSILILMRSDTKGNISKNLASALTKQNVNFAVKTTEATPLETPQGRKVLSIMRLLDNPKDNLAWYTWLKLTDGIGEKRLNKVRQFAIERKIKFYDALVERNSNDKLSSEVIKVNKYLEEFRDIEESLEEQVHNIIIKFGGDAENQINLEKYLTRIISETNVTSLSDLFISISGTMEKIEQEQIQGKVNIMTMHKAKGLDADVVFIVGAEKQFIPGKNLGESEGDERRLFYVSITRARHSLFITYCKERIKEQRYLGSESGKSKRQLTPFLEDSFLKPEYIS
ncbi:MAG: DNA helicase II [Firmicutes bacterium ADurb.Bin419]|jgi:DNA helicase-2/ATP-dependent DNA helicase PcrA|nr:MAG: DNA helicase II [Firmicutes bacterium ADurb.Bin419]